MKKMVIVGGGVAGLSAGIYGCLSGYDCTVLEKNSRPGGNLTGWDRGGFHIDNCIHWLTGTLPGTELYGMWETLGALGPEVKLCSTPRLYGCELGGSSVSMYPELQRTREEMLALAPYDRRSIDRFIDGVELCARVMGPGGLRGTRDAAGGLKLMRYLRTDGFSLAAGFRHPLLRRVMTDYIPGDYVAAGLMMAYGAYVSGNGGIPEGGSAAMADRMAERFKKLGGHLVTGAEVCGIRVENTAASGALLRDGELVPGDWVVCAADPEVTFGRLLGRRFTPARLRSCGRSPEQYPLFSSFHAAFSVEGGAEEVGNTAVFDIRPLRVGRECVGRMALREYSHQPSFSPRGRSVLQTMVFQREADCRRWQALRVGDGEAYSEEKLRLGTELLNRVTDRFPALTGRIGLLDTWTPATYSRYFGSNCGAYMGWAMVPGGRRRQVASRLKGLDNVLLATQWQSLPGGLPTAAASGRLAVRTALSLDRPGKSLARAAAM